MSRKSQVGARIAAGLSLVLAAGVLSWVTAAPVLPRRASAVSLPVRVPPVVADPLDGEPVPQALAERRPIGVVIDNHPDARPQRGLSLASRIYEAITEGGITRYLVVFGARDADQVGPVRSARTQFLDYTLELKAALAHVGGNSDALDLIAGLHMVTLDQVRYADAYRRIFRQGVAFEHTVFTWTALLRARADRLGRDAHGSLDTPTWKDDVPPDHRPTSQRVTIDFSTREYRVSWVYLPGSNDYQRILAGAPDVDAATGKALSAKVVAIAVVPRTHGRTRIREETWTFADLGSGKAWVVQDGTVTEGTWHKIARTDRLRFFDQDGSEVAFVRGPQWVEIVPPEVTPVFE